MTGAMSGRELQKASLSPPVNDVESPSPKKRKFSVSADETINQKPKGKKRKNKRAKSDDLDHDIDLEHSLNRSIAKMDRPLLADHFSKQTKRFAPNLSFLELQDRRLPEIAFRDTSTWNKPRSLTTLPSFLKSFTGSSKPEEVLSKSPKEPGSPHTLVVTAAGLRAADISRAIKTFQTGESSVAKLFAKHIKLRDAIDYVKKTRIGIGVGTPSRLTDLIEAGALSTIQLRRIVVDASHINQKKQGILDMRETQEALVDFLTKPEIKKEYGEDSNAVQILCF